ncbi:MAG: hypothetical protein LBH06_04855 [Rikenellaceae bacterium]|nr:hypothetical protein [Rikenellaceae bacterium]
MRLAGKNRAELEKVLAHYAAAPDTLKLNAARFLIENMPGHYSYNRAGMELFAEQAMPVIRSNASTESKQKSLEEISTSLTDRISVEQDVKTVTADYLIYSIDDAFRLWREEPYATHLDFDEFCEYLLPYKVVDPQPLDYWRDTLRHTFDAMQCRLINSEDYSYNNLYIARAANQKMKKEMKPSWSGSYGGFSFLGASLLGKTPFGTCDDYAIASVRSCGAKAFR